MNKREILANIEGEWLLADGFDDAIIGTHDEIVVYSKTKCIEILMKEDQLSEEDALDYYYFNVVGSYVGENTPIFIEDDFFY